jgi:polar amino acid transport system ATP-binding protein
MIKVEHLSKKFGNLTVLKDVSVDIKKGEVISVIGPSGTGKSTFLRCLNLLERPSGGSIWIDGVDILDKKADVPAIRQKMNMVFQSFNLFSHLSVLENLTIAPVRLKGMSKRDADAKSMELLRMVGLLEKVSSYPYELSGGQKQRVAIARCLAMEPEIILFDEPTSALDPTMISEVLAVIRRLAREGMTLLIVTHEMDFARDLSSRVLYMDEGVIYEEGASRQIFENPKREKTRLFIRRIRSVNFQVGSPDFDLYAMNAEIERFCEKQMLPPETQNRVLLLVEELLMLYRPLLMRTIPLDITIRYTEKTGHVEMMFDFEGEEFNPLQQTDQADELGLTLINNLAERIAFERLGTKNRLIIRGLKSKVSAS